MFLAVDVGNSNVKVGLWQRDWRMVWRARTEPDRLADEYALLFKGLLHSIDLDFRSVSGAAISSVVPTLTPVFRELVRRYVRVEPLIVTAGTPTGLRLELDRPEQIGTDRLVNAAAVAALYGGPAIAVDCGTATKFDVVLRGGVYTGGAISPGLAVMHDALVQRAALLSPVDIGPPSSPIGSNSVRAMQSGLYWGYVALVEDMAERIKTSIPDGPVRVILTGGQAPVIRQHVSAVDVLAPELTLDGLRIIYELNSSL